MQLIAVCVIMDNTFQVTLALNMVIMMTSEWETFTVAVERVVEYTELDEEVCLSKIYTFGFKA